MPRQRRQQGRRRRLVLPRSQPAKMTTKAQESAKAREASESAKPPTPRLNSPSAQRPASPLGSAGAGRARDALALASERGPPPEGARPKRRKGRAQSTAARWRDEPRKVCVEYDL